MHSSAADRAVRSVMRGRPAGPTAGLSGSSVSHGQPNSAGVSPHSARRTSRLDSAAGRRLWRYAVAPPARRPRRNLRSPTTNPVGGTSRRAPRGPCVAALRAGHASPPLCARRTSEDMPRDCCAKAAGRTHLIVSGADVAERHGTPQYQPYRWWSCSRRGRRRRVLHRRDSMPTPITQGGNLMRRLSRVCGSLILASVAAASTAQGLITEPTFPKVARSAPVATSQFTWPLGPSTAGDTTVQTGR
jgi:hypothetical protein